MKYRLKRRRPAPEVASSTLMFWRDILHPFVGWNPTLWAVSDGKVWRH